MIEELRFPGAAQHVAQRSDAPQNRDRTGLRICDDPGSAVHRYALHRVREKPTRYGSLNAGFMPSGIGMRKVLSVIDTKA